MPNRREFLKDAAGTAAGIVFVGCGLHAAQTPASSARRRSVVIRGKKIRTIDIHAHCSFPKAEDLLKRHAINATTTVLEGQSLTQRMADMDAQGIDTAILSINAQWYDVDRDLVTQVITIQNEALAEFTAKHPDRFQAFASVALQYPDLAAQQLEHGMKRQGLRGAAIGGSVAGVELSDPKFHPFWAKAEELGATVFIHPQPSADLSARLKGNGVLRNIIWNPLETTIALSHLIFEGTLDRFPRLKICAAHGGGYLPSYMNRSDHACRVFPEECKAGVPKRHPTEYLKDLYYDSILFTAEGLRHLIAEVGVGRIVLGTDYPYSWAPDAVDHILKTPGLSDAEREGILNSTAAKLLGL